MPMRAAQKQELLDLLEVVKSDEQNIHWCTLQYITWLRHLKNFSDEALGEAITVAAFALQGERDTAKEIIVRSIEIALFGHSEYRVREDQTKETDDE